jgi:choline transporter-like protein 2/4/5
LLVVLCGINRIRLAIGIIKTAADFVKDCPCAMVIPLVIFLLVLVFWGFWICGMIMIYSMGTVTNIPGEPYGKILWDPNTKIFLGIFIFSGLWKNAFLMALTQFILASTCCIWYFSHGPGQSLHRPISKSVYRAFRYHLGSLAFGSFILALVQFIRLVLAYVEQ